MMEVFIKCDNKRDAKRFIEFLIDNGLSWCSSNIKISVNEFDYNGFLSHKLWFVLDKNMNAWIAAKGSREDFISMDTLLSIPKGRLKAYILHRIAEQESKKTI